MFAWPSIVFEPCDDPKKGGHLALMKIVINNPTPGRPNRARVDGAPVWHFVSGCDRRPRQVG